ncbi:MAG: hypothetical protein ABGW90_11720 [Martelella sp.]
MAKRWKVRFIIAALSVAIAAPANAQAARDDILQIMGAAFALTTFCPDLRYNSAALTTLEAVYGIDVSEEETGIKIRAIRTSVGKALDDGRTPESVCPMARAWFGPIGAILPGLLIDK